MQDHELDAWLGGVEATEAQRALLLAAAEVIEGRYSDEEAHYGAASAAMTGASMVALGDASTRELVEAWGRATRAADEAHAVMTGGLVAAVLASSEVAAARDAGVTRMTVRKAMGKD